MSPKDLLDRLRRAPALRPKAGGLSPALGAGMAVAVFALAGPGPALVLILVLAALAMALSPRAAAAVRPADTVTGLADRKELLLHVERQLANGGDRGDCGVLLLEIDRFSRIVEDNDHATVESVLRVCAARLTRCLRSDDRAARLEGAIFAIALAPSPRLDLEAALQLATRLQRALQPAIAVPGGAANPTASIGFVLSGRLSPAKGDHITAEDMMRAASMAMIEAGRNGPSAVRSYSDAMHMRISGRSQLMREAAEALERGEITAFFQPQVSAVSGALTGFEALARWRHPERGLIPPADFLPALAQAGLMGQLGAHMVTEALRALQGWDRDHLPVPRVGVNFSTEELSDPGLVDRIAFQLDSFGVAAGRLGIEVLETVVAAPSDDIIRHNLSALARLGCALDMDDFGTGHAAITNVRRLSVGRIKIDRSFVARIDADREQQDMVAAILTMAERLGLDTLAEGVETPAEVAMLRQLGCGHLQGYGIARPMPLADTFAWIRAAADRAAAAPLRQAAI